MAQNALADRDDRTALITYTRNGVREIEDKILQIQRSVPKNVEVSSWYTFMLREMVRPYRRAVHDKRIDSILWVNGRSVPRIPASHIAHYVYGGNQLYSDKVSKFVLRCEQMADGAVLKRLSERFTHLIVDEVQDMAGYDLDLLREILRSGMRVTLVGDFRQATFATNNSAKNKKFARTSIIDLFKQWEKEGLVRLEYESHTYRCNQAIADLGDLFFPEAPKTNSLNNVVTGHDGIFLVRKEHVPAYMAQFSPQVLRYDANTNCDPYDAMNFGQSKGMTFDRVLIFPNKGTINWIKSGSIAFVEKSAAKLYVGVTRARYSVAFVHDGAQYTISASRWEPDLAGATFITDQQLHAGGTSA